MDVELIVAGSCGGYPRPGRACSGYILRYGSENLILDLGAGSFSNMLLDLGLGGITAVVITHMHPDHYVDIYALYTARRFNFIQPALPVFLPPGGKELLELTLTGNTRSEFFEYLEVAQLDESQPVTVAGFEIAARLAEHPMPNMALRVSAGGRTICYSGDTDMCDSLVGQARGADLFLCEATFTSEVPRRIPGHLFAVEAGEVAERAGVGKLLLTHIWPTFNEEIAVEDARGSFKGPVEAAVEGMTVTI